MDQKARSGFRNQIFVWPGMILALVGMAVFLHNSENATIARAQTAACTQISDSRDIPSPKIITFDDLTDGTLLNTQYETGYGVTFPGGQSSIPAIHTVTANEKDTPASPPNVARNAGIPDVPKTPLVINFTFPRSYVGMFLGNGGMLRTGGPVVAQVSAYDVTGGQLCTFRVVVSDLPHTFFAGMYDASGSISSVTIDYGASTNESIDNLYLLPGANYGARKPLPTWTPVPTALPTPGPRPTPTPELPLFAVYAYKAPVIQAPILFPPDFGIFNIEITQGIQCFNGAPAGCVENSLPKVLSKSTVVRVYVQARNGFSHYNHVPVRLHLLAFGKEYIMDALGNATSSLNQNTHDAAEFYFTVYSGAASNVGVWAEVDPDHLFAASYLNNRFPTSGSSNHTFNNRKTMTVAGERLYYHPAGYSGSQYAGGWAVNGGAAQWWNQVLPVSDNGINYFVRSGYLDWTLNLSSGDAQHALISTLNFMWIKENALSWWFGTGPFTGARHVYGWAPAQGYSGGHADMPIYPHAGGLGVVGIGSDAPGTNTDNPGSGALIFGHELTHDYNIFHTNTSDACGSNDTNSNFPYSNSSIQAFGFNTLTGKIYHPSLTQDLMSYCPSGGSKLGWISPFTWGKMYPNLSLAAIPSQPVYGPFLGNAVPTGYLIPAASSQSLVVEVTLNNPGGGTTHSGHFNTLSRIPAVGPAPAIITGTYSIEEQDGGGNVLFSQSFQVDFTSEYKPMGGVLPPPPFPPGDTPLQDASFIVPFIDGTRNVLLFYNGSNKELLDTRAVPQNAPQVAITSPTSPVDWPANSTQKLSWTGFSLDNLALTYSVFYSNDGGTGWVILDSDLVTTTYHVNVDAMAGGSDVRFRVLASDGINTGFDETPANITIPNHPPMATITEPGSQTFHSPGDLIVFHGGATDMEDGTLPGSALVWSDDIQGGLGIGPTVPINTLSPGKHTITLTATDSYGISSSASVTIFVGYPFYLPMVRK